MYFLLKKIGHAIRKSPALKQTIPWFQYLQSQCVAHPLQLICRTGITVFRGFTLMLANGPIVCNRKPRGSENINIPFV